MPHPGFEYDGRTDSPTRRCGMRPPSSWPSASGFASCLVLLIAAGLVALFLTHRSTTRPPGRSRRGRTGCPLERDGGG